MSRTLTEKEQEYIIKKYLTEQYQIPYKWNPIDIYNQKNPYIKSADRVIIEIGPGNGDFLIHMARQNPIHFYLGIEIKRKRVKKCTSKSYKRNLNNIGFILGDAKIILITKEIKQNCVDEYYLTFPDPWPKKKHMKNRIFTNEFISVIYQSLKPEGKFTIATDHKDYLIDIINTIDYFGKFKYVLENKISNNLENFYQSYFEKLWREKGKDIYYCIIQK